MYRNDFSVLWTSTVSATKVVGGQLIDRFNPVFGLGYHITTTATARNTPDQVAGIAGIVVSGIRILNNTRYQW